MSNFYYDSLIKLLGGNFLAKNTKSCLDLLDPDLDLKQRTITLCKFSSDLASFGLFSFQHRLFNKLSFFYQWLKNGENTPVELKDLAVKAHTNMEDN